MASPSIYDVFRQVREAAAAARVMLDSEERRLCSELAEYRNQQGMTQQEVSDLVGVSRSQIANIEAGRGVSVEALLAYAAAVGCEVVLTRAAEGRA